MIDFLKLPYDFPQSNVVFRAFKENVPFHTHEVRHSVSLELDLLDSDPRYVDVKLGKLWVRAAGLWPSNRIARPIRLRGVLVRRIVPETHFRERRYRFDAMGAATA